MITAIIGGFFAGQRYGHESGLSNWQSLPTETVTYYVGRMLPGELPEEIEIENLIGTINSTVIPEFCKGDPRLLIEADGESTLRIRGNVVVLATVGEFLTKIENEQLSNLELNEANKVQFYNAKRLYFSLKDKFEPEASSHNEPDDNK